MEGEAVDWIHLAGSCKHDNEPYGSIRRQFLYSMSNN